MQERTARVHARAAMALDMVAMPGTHRDAAVRDRDRAVHNRPDHVFTPRDLCVRAGGRRRSWLRVLVRRTASPTAPSGRGRPSKRPAPVVPSSARGRCYLQP